MLNVEQRLKNKTAVIGIVSFDYVRLPLAIAFSGADFKVPGFDIQQKRVNIALVDEFV